VRLETEANKPVLHKAGKATLQALLSAFGKVCTGQDVNATASVLTQAIANATEEAATSTKRVFTTGNSGTVSGVWKLAVHRYLAFASMLTSCPMVPCTFHALHEQQQCSSMCCAGCPPLMSAVVWGSPTHV
ncbi:hypothetical protein HaLaN_32935, partial [Haematococcus lacustris]